MTRQLKTSRVFVPGGAHCRDRFYPLIRISGKWLEAHGFRESAPLYVTETMDGLLISPRPPAGTVLPPLEIIKEKYKALGIETETRVKPKRSEIPPDQRRFFKITKATKKEYEEY